MHLRLLGGIAVLAGSVLLPAQVPVPVVDSAAVVSSGVIGERWTDEELEDLLAPVALHPDALIALILPASTNPSDVVLAARRLAINPDPTRLDEEPWDDSVRGLARYPEVVKWMDENLSWTKELGLAFSAQPADVMNAIQRLRMKARAAGTLQDTPQQQVVVMEEEIRIVPAQTEVIYVPRYDPTVVYVSRPVYYPSAFLTFGIGYPVGYWLAYDCDWRYRTVWVVPPPHRARVWYERHDWRRHSHTHRVRDDRWHAWHPRPAHPRPGGGDIHHRYRHDGSRSTVSRPTQPSWPRDGQRSDSNWSRDRDRTLDRDETPISRWQRERLADRNRFPGSGSSTGERRWDRSRDGEANHPHQRSSQPRSGGDGRRDNRTVGSDLPGGPTPSIAAPVGPVASVSPTTVVQPPAAPRVSPNGRRLPGNEAPREFVRAPNGRHMVAPPSASPAPAAPAPVHSTTVAAPRETSRPQFNRPDVARSEAPRQWRSEGGGRSDSAARSGGSDQSRAHRSNDPGRSPTNRDAD
jgi:hypothetical protein